MTQIWVHFDSEYMFCFFLELNWQFTLCSFLTSSNRSSAGCSLHQLSPPHRGSSCALHPGCAPCTLGSSVEVRGVGSVWASSTADSSHTHTHRQASLLSLAFTLERQWRRQAEESGMAASGCRQAVVIWLDYQPGGNIQPLYSLYSSFSSSSLPSSAASIYHLHAHILFSPCFFFPSFLRPSLLPFNIISTLHTHTHTHMDIRIHYRPLCLIIQASTHTETSKLMHTHASSSFLSTSCELFVCEGVCR